MAGRHLILHTPDSWSNDQRGSFFEDFISKLIVPMRFAIEKRLRVTGMEIDLLARGLDQPRKILIECKAQRDAIPADVISKLIGNVTIRSADSGWLFATSDLGKEARGQWEEIQEQPDLAAKFMWFPPDRVIDILQSQHSVVDPSIALLKLAPAPPPAGDATLICSPSGLFWFVELLRDGIPSLYTVLDAKSGAALSESEAAAIAALSDRFSALEFQEIRAATIAPPAGTSMRSPIARVVSGDAWDDLRPSRPIDFVGRDDLRKDILKFVDNVRVGQTATRTFAVQGPSGWGKSSLVIKLVDLVAKGRRIANCSLTAVDSRSATSAAFVSGALRLALNDAARAGLVTRASHDIASLTHPLDSPDVIASASELAASNSVAVLVFDQFEELFSKEALLETFNAIRELSVDLDSKQFPIVLGFAWKTDVSLPQQHPAYHLWHSLTDRRRDFRVRQFGPPDIGKVISHAQRQIQISLVPALRTRLGDQCQGYPWLLKKLLVHIAKSLKAEGSQYELLDQDLNVQSLFDEDLAGLTSDQIHCLKYVAERSPAYIIEVEEHFSSEIANFLLEKRLLVKSGLNYVIYWDIFRDYLLENRAPQIPWTRTFQRDPGSAVLAINLIKQKGNLSAKYASEVLGGSERGWLNVMSDLVALQLVDRVAEDNYTLAPHVKSVAPLDLAEHVHAQFSRHVICRDLSSLERGSIVTNEMLDSLVERIRATSAPTPVVIHQYAMNLKRWLLFSGHLEERGNLLYRPSSKGAQMGILKRRRERGTKFLGNSSPEAVLALLARLREAGKDGVLESALVSEGMRNSIYDGVALQLIERSENRTLNLSRTLVEAEGVSFVLARQVLKQPSVSIVFHALRVDPDMPNLALGERLRTSLQQSWKPTSGLRYAAGVRRYVEWALQQLALQFDEMRNGS